MKTKMMEKIKLNSSVFDRVLKASDLKELLDTKEYVAKMRHQSHKLLTDTEKNVVQIKEKIYEEVSTEIRTENAKQLQILYDNLQLLLNQLNDKLFDMVYQVLMKLGYAEINSLHVKNLIKEEVGDVMSHQPVKIIANEALLIRLKEDFAAKKQDAISWAINNQLSDEECICETKLWSLRINVTTLKEQINNILAIGGKYDG